MVVNNLYTRVSDVMTEDPYCVMAARYAPRDLHSTILLTVFSNSPFCVATPISRVPFSIRLMVPCFSSPAA